MEYEVILPDNDVPPTDTSPQKLTTELDTSPAAVLARAERQAHYLSQIRRELAHAETAADRQRLRGAHKRNQKIKNRRRSVAAAQSRKRNR